MYFGSFISLFCIALTYCEGFSDVLLISFTMSRRIAPVASSPTISARYFFAVSEPSYTKISNGVPRDSSDWLRSFLYPMYSLSFMSCPAAVIFLSPSSFSDLSSSSSGM